jgi:hypothetical protein
MVAEGKVTPEQAAELLDALGPSRQPPPRPAPDLGSLFEEVLSRALGGRLGKSFVAPAAPRPPRPPRPPRSPRSVRLHHAVPGPSFSGATGRQGLTFEELVELKTEGVSKRYVDEMSDLFPDITMSDLLECHEGGVQPGYARAMLSIFGELDMAHLVEMHESGVDAAFAAALVAEFPDLEPSDVIEAAEEGVDIEDIEFFRTRGPRGRRDEEGEGDDPPSSGARGDEGPTPA